MNRREFLRGAAGAAAGLVAPFLSACEEPKEEQYEPQRSKEQEGIPREGDVLFVGGAYYLIRNKSRYLLAPEVFRRHRRDSKFDQYGRKLIIATERDLRGFSLERISEEPLFLDPIGAGKEFKPWGGEALLFLAGFLEEDAVPYFDVRPKNTFASILGKDGLEKDGWGINHSLFFTYGVEGLGEYKVEHTARHPEENKKHAVEFGEKLKNNVRFSNGLR